MFISDFRLWLPIAMQLILFLGCCLVMSQRLAGMSQGAAVSQTPVQTTLPTKKIPSHDISLVVSGHEQVFKVFQSKKCICFKIMCKYSLYMYEL